MKEKFKQDRIVAFIDILGFSELVNKSESLEKIYEAVCNFQKYSIEGISFGGLKDYYSKEENRDRQVSVFSDLIVISYKYHEDNDYYSMLNLYELLSGLIRAQTILIRERILVRGGITKGNLFHNNEVCIGKGLIEAYILESKVATYPIILINPSLIISQKFENFEFKEPIQNLIINQLENGFYYIDYFKYLYDPYEHPLIGKKKEFESVNNMPLLQLKNLIEEGLQSKKIDIWSKYKWLSGKYNKLILDIEKNCSNEDKSIENIDNYKLENF